MRDVASIIRRRAQLHGVDPAAALAVARGEGGLRFGAVGDQGTSFGPFQLHRGGALPAGRGAAWANSPAGIDYAIRKMAEAGAAGQTGARAVETIIRNFERPADPDTSVRNALGRLGASAGPALPNTPAPTRSPSASRPETTVRKPDLSGVLAALGTAKSPKLFPTRKRRELIGPKLEVAAAPEAPIDAVMESSSLGARAVKAAASQLGKPYVFGSGPSTESFDCSDLVQWSYKQLGVAIPRDTYGQMKVLPKKKWKDLQIGDPLYRKNGGHVVIYAGNGRVIAAPKTGDVVKYQPLSDFSQKDYDPYSIDDRTLT